VLAEAPRRDRAERAGSDGGAKNDVEPVRSHDEPLSRDGDDGSAAQRNVQPIAQERDGHSVGHKKPGGRRQMDRFGGCSDGKERPEPDVSVQGSEEEPLTRRIEKHPTDERQKNERSEWPDSGDGACRGVDVDPRKGVDQQQTSAPKEANREGGSNGPRGPEHEPQARSIV
jgi:hypothetical protein